MSDLFATFKQGENSLASDAKFKFVQQADDSWQLLTTVNSKSVEITSTDPRLIEIITEIKSTLATTPDSDKISELANSLNERMNHLKVIRDIDHGYEEMFTSETNFINQMKYFVTFMENTGLNAVSNPITKQKIDEYLQPYRDIIAIQLLPEMNATPSASAADAIEKVQSLSNLFVSADNSQNLTYTFQNMINSLTQANVDMAGFNKLLNDNPKILTALQADPSTKKLPSLESYTIQPIQRAMRYKSLWDPIIDNLTGKKLITTDEEKNAIASIEPTIKAMGEIALALNETQREIDTKRNTLLTFDVLGHIQNSSAKLVASLPGRTPFPEIEIINTLQEKLVTISSQIIKNNLQLGDNVGIKSFVLPSKEFLPPIAEAFAQSYLSHKPKEKNDTSSAILNFVQNLDKKLIDQGLPPVVNDKNTISGSTIFGLMGKADLPGQTWRAELRDTIVKNLFDATINSLTGNGNKQDKLAYKRAIKAITAIGPTAITSWNQLAATPFPSLILPENLKVASSLNNLPPNLKFEVQRALDIKKPSQPHSDLYQQALNSQPIHLTPTSAPNPIGAALGSISNALNKINNQMTKNNYPDNNKIYQTYMNGMSRLVSQLSQNPTATLPRDKFYAITMDAFTAGLIIHEKGGNDIFKTMIRDAVTTVDKALHSIGLPGIVYADRKSLPGTTDKDANALATLKSHPEYNLIRVDSLFNEKNPQKDIYLTKITPIINHMDDAAIQKWSELAGPLGLDLSDIREVKPSRPDMESTLLNSDSDQEESLIEPFSATATTDNDNDSDLDHIEIDFTDGPMPLSAFSNLSVADQARVVAENDARRELEEKSRASAAAEAENERVTAAPVVSNNNSPNSDSNVVLGADAPPAPPTHTTNPAASNSNDSSTTSQPTAVVSNDNSLNPDSDVVLGADAPPAPPTHTTNPAASNSNDSSTTSQPTAVVSNDNSLNPDSDVVLGADAPPPPPTHTTNTAALNSNNSSTTSQLSTTVNNNTGIPTPPTPPPINGTEVPAPTPESKPIPNINKPLRPPTTTEMLAKIANFNALFKPKILSTPTLDKTNASPIIPPVNQNDATPTPSVTVPTDTESVLTASSVQTSGPNITSTRDNGFLEPAKIKAMTPVLVHAGWKLSAEKVVNNERMREATYDSNGIHREFTITQKELRTKDSDVETFKAMLKCFQASHSVLPAISTSSPELKQKWMQAFAEVYPARKNEANMIITVNQNRTPNQTPIPTAPTPSSPRPK